MFSILIAVGIVFIILGICICRHDTEDYSQEPDVPYKNVENLILLEKRVEEIERILSEDVDEPEDELGYGLENYRLLKKYEAENYSIEEICELLNMNKGEVILLKNLYGNL